MRQNRFLTFLFLLFVLYGFNFCVINAEEVVNMRYIGHHGDHYVVPADIPEVYFDADNQEVIIVADGFSSYYDVEIVSQSTMQLVLSTQVDGYGDSIDISSLSDDNYTIVITSEFNNVYQGQFSNY